jgi:hypothetical protein
MKEHPILFSAPMVRAILEGRKTQTRRVVKFRPTFFKGITGQLQEHHEMEACYPMPRGGFVFWSDKVGKAFSDRAYKDDEGGYLCPYGQVGDRLWVRETWAKSPAGFIFKADYNVDDGFGSEVVDMKSGETIPLVWKPSIHMPRVISRIILEIVNVRVERLQDICESDAQAEGIAASIVGSDLDCLKFRAGYQTLWNSINDSRGFGWDVNPWVWVIEFQRAGLTPHVPDTGDAPRFWDVATKPDVTFLGDVPLKSPRR